MRVMSHPLERVEMSSRQLGLYLLAYDERDRPIASGGWRRPGQERRGVRGRRRRAQAHVRDPEARGLGLARRILAALEDDARAAGRTRMVLETGAKQPEAVALYLSSGYEPCAKFGYYRFHELSLCYAKPLTIQ